MAVTTTDTRARVAMPAGRLATVCADVALFAGTDAARPALEHVRIWADAGVFHAEATDSYRLARFSVDADCEPFPTVLVAADVVRTFAKTLKGVRPASRPTVLEVADGWARLPIDGIGGTVAALDYPDTDRLFRLWKGGAIESVALSPALLATYGKMACLKGSGRNKLGKPLRVELGATDMKPVRISGGQDNVTFVSILMPVLIP